MRRTGDDERVDPVDSVSVESGDGGADAGRTGIERSVAGIIIAWTDVGGVARSATVVTGGMRLTRHLVK